MPSSVIPLKVAVRARPLIQKELDEGCQSCLNFAPGEPQIILGKNRAFTYDYVFKPTDLQIPVYEDAVKPLLVHIFKGYNATVLAYGQTGSGKTFTMGGGYEASLKMDPEGMGVIPRIVQEIFLTMNEKEEYEYTLKVSYLEIINEDLQDLLVNNKNKDSLNIREENGEIKIPGLREVGVDSAEAVMRCLEQGSVNRTVGSTAMNNTSSRSHAIFIINIEQKNKEDMNDFWRSKLQLVDLAGSERVKKTHAEGERFKEGININKGLLALGNVISALGEDNQKEGTTKKHIPYRDSKLTRILQDSLGGNSHTLMIACISPADSNMEETLNSLRYADRARKIKNKPVVNWDPQTAEIMRLKDQVSQLTMKLLNHGLLDVSESTTSTDSMPVQTRTEIIKSCEKCPFLEDENGKLSQQLQMTLDQVYASTEKAVRLETKNERLVTRLHDLEEGVGIDFDLLSSTVTAENHPEIVQQLEKLKSLSDKLHENKTSEEMTEEENSMEEEEVLNSEEHEIPDTPESRELVRQFTQKRAERTKELEQINKMIENNQKLRDQMSQNDQKMQEQIARQYEEKIASLQSEKSDLHLKLEEAQTNTVAMKLSEQRRKRLMELEQQISSFKKKLNEQKNIVKLKEQSEKKVTAMNVEIQALKQQRVKLMKQMKEDATAHKKWKQQKDKEVLQLQQKDRKRQFEIQKLQRENQKQHTVLQRKSEEAAAANRRLKEALAKQKKVLEEKNQKFEKYDNTAIGNRIKKLLSYELDVQVGIYEAKYHRDELMTDRKTLSEELKNLKESLDDNGPPSKKMAWMDDSGTKCQTSFQEEEKKRKIEELQHQIELRNIQISDLQQKIFDADQEVKGKSIKDTVHTMMEAKIGLKWLLQQAVSFKANNSQLRMQLKDLKDDKDETGTENENYIETLEKDMAEMKETHQATIVKLRQEHQKELEILLKPQEQQTGVVNSDKYVPKELYADLKRKYEKVEKNMTTLMYKSKKVALMPDITDDDEPAEARSPFLTPRAKPNYKRRLAEEVDRNIDNGDDDDDDDGDYGDDDNLINDGDESYNDDKNLDPDWAKTPLFKKDPSFKSSARRKTDLFKQNMRVSKMSNSKRCKCQSNCKTKRCVCRKIAEYCDELCGCTGCENRENGAASANQNDKGEGYKMPEIITSDMEDDQQTSQTLSSVASSVLNTTFDIDESPTEKDPKPEVKKPSAKVTGKPPLKMKKQRGRSVLMALSDNSVRSSDEFEQPMRKTASSGSLRRRSNSFTKGDKVAKSASNLRKSGSLKKRSSSNTELDKLGKTEENLSMDGLAKKRRLYSAKDSFFQDIYAEKKENS